MKYLRLLSTLAVAGAAALAAAPAAADASVTTQSSASENWSGYAASNPSGSGQFQSVSGSWVEPTVNCSSNNGYDAFWVGLGGTSDQNQALEQIGTQAACNGSGAAQHFAWYELVPAGPVNLDVSIHPGDRISAKVTVNGSTVIVSLTNDTTGNSTSKTVQMSNPDTSSAEWIAEAPSQCDSSGNCQPLPLANFGSVNFTGASATADGNTGSISSWNAQPVQLEPGSQFVSSGGATSQAGAQPTSLSSDGSSFTVDWLANGVTSDSSGGSTQSSGGYPGGDGSGGYPGGDGSGGYGSGYPGGSGSGGGYGSGGYGYGYGYGGLGAYLYGSGY